MVVDTALVDIPTPASDPFAEAAELGTPPALAELSEYIEDTDMRFESISDVDVLGRNARSGGWEGFESSAMAPGVDLGGSKSSTAISSLLVFLLDPNPCFQNSAVSGVCWLYVEEILDRMEGLGEGDGIEMLARSEWMSLVPGSAYGPFLLDAELEREAEDRLWEAVRVLSLGNGGGSFRTRPGSGRGKSCGLGSVVSSLPPPLSVVGGRFIVADFASTAKSRLPVVTEEQSLGKAWSLKERSEETC